MMQTLAVKHWIESKLEISIGSLLLEPQEACPEEEEEELWKAEGLGTQGLHN